MSAETMNPKFEMSKKPNATPANSATSSASAVVEVAVNAADSSGDHTSDGDHASSDELIERRKKFGNWLRDCRRTSRITQAELAKALNYDSSQLISNIERGVSLLPSRRLPDFARVLGCSLLEMEVRYFQCSAKNTSESRMPDLLLKYLPVIEVLEYGNVGDQEILAAIRAIK